MLLTAEKHGFLLDLIDIINALGTPKENISVLGFTGNGIIYEDSLLKITSVKNHNYLVATRKSTENPMIMLENDIVIRFHGEFIYLKEHINNLLKQIKEDKDENTEPDN